MINKLIPDLQVDTIYDIVLADLWKEGIRGIITDLDNTLVGAKVPLATPELIQWLKHLQSLGFKVVIVSNNNESRVGNFARPLNIPFIHRARKPANQAFHRAMSIMELKTEHVAVIGDQMLTDVLGGNRMGLFTILVKPISLMDEGFFTRINRKVEKAARVFIKK
ncbi:YqeG family HAD IIIA-type phosphatase [Paenibacillus senegalensis]|uniref:YqeG family HAD IIIA-type phosphatase n=1 Tax=Paenibacillus senegalensis TaxID=1465766 RepID=UPI000288D4C6|nr:YqeG family HAD IIIA-type phosphatase [Paenibacillus senegalensis]